jgi:hypothetical protein
MTGMLRKMSVDAQKTFEDLNKWIIAEYQITPAQAKAWWNEPNVFFQDDKPINMIDNVHKRRRLNLFLGAFRPKEKTGLGFLDTPALIENVLNTTPDRPEEADGQMSLL